MPRVAREKSKTGIYHIILRGINRQTIFEDEEDAEKFLETLEELKKESGYKIFAYCLMGNHIHILIKEEKEDLSIVMRRIGASYVYWYNLKYDRIGHLFQDRYKSEVVEDEKYLLTVLRYIHQNPVKAHLVRDIKEFKWSSYPEYTNKRRIIDNDFILDLFHQNRQEAILMFKEFHEKESNNDCLDIDEKKRIKDGEAITIIKEICHISHCADIQKLDRAERDKYIKIIREKGISTRQLARITGINRNIILKA